LEFPKANIEVLKAERTFWEKVTLIHAALNCGSLEQTAERMSRHWSDLTIFMKNEVGEVALKDEALALRVIEHKDKFWRDGQAKYDDCKNKNFKLVPSGKALSVLKADYEAMIDAGMFFELKPASFDEMLQDIASLEKRLNT
jgi:hypothetical protein